MAAFLLPLALSSAAPGVAQDFQAAGSRSLTQPHADVRTTPIALASGAAGQLVDERIAGPFDTATGLVFDHNSELLVWDRYGRVFWIDGGVTHPTPVIDISDEVGTWGDHGMLGFALHPNYQSNGYIYLSYMVDRHHVLHFGTPSYDPLHTDLGQDSMARVTRYTMRDPENPALGVLAASRKILIGDAIDNGIPVCGSAHSTGSLLFGEDGTLLIATGDGFSVGAAGNCLTDGFISPKENISRYRSQLVDSHSGKILRINPFNGEGIPTNPWYDAAEPSAPRSRVWVLGLRNPFRVSLRPGTGSASDPGTLYIGDVGLNSWEELNVATSPGQNFGWPAYEGDEQTAYYASAFQNFDAPNALFGQTIPGVGLCGQAFHTFQDLLIDETLGAQSWPNPCDPLLQITDAPTHMHARPILAWDHMTMAWVKDFDGGGDPIEVTLGTPQSPVVGDSFFGNCSVGGFWYTGSAYPAIYHGTYFHADFGANWIRNLVFGADDELLEVRSFSTAERVVSMVMHPDEETIYYLSFLDPEYLTESSVRRIRFVPNAPPTASVSPELAFGPGPLAVEFDATLSTDPEGGELGYEWDFGDGTPLSFLPSPRHVYPSEDITSQGTIVSRLDELPPYSSPFPGDDISVIQDGDWPPVGNADPNRQYSSVHFGGGGSLLKAGSDWVGYTFPAPREFIGLFYQQGILLGAGNPVEGGYFDSLTIEVRDDLSGLWSPVPGAGFLPVYGGAVGEDYAVFEARFDGVTGDGIRIQGAPGGADEFVSVAELRVLATPTSPPVGPVNYTVDLRVTDDVNLVSERTALVSLNNTPPQVTINLPLNGDTYDNTLQSNVDLSAGAVDAEHGTLDCAWQLILHHDNHEHPDPTLPVCATQSLLIPHGVDGEDVYYEARFTATDPLGLSTTESHWLAPDDDCNLNGLDDFDDIQGGFSLDVNFNGIPDECESDCDTDGISDPFEIVSGLDSDCDGNGVPDSCESLPDCDGDGLADACVIASGASTDFDGNGIPDECDPLRADVATLSLTAGGSQTLSIDVGPENGGRLYWILGGAEGTTPAKKVGGELLPLHLPSVKPSDLILPVKLVQRAGGKLPVLLLGGADLGVGAPLVNKLDRLDSAGRATETVKLASADPSLIGIQVHHAALVMGFGGEALLATNAVPLVIEP